MAVRADHTGPRLEELDSLRGLAALVVFSSHCLLLLPSPPPWLQLAVQAPTGLLLAGGHPAVLVFFLLSGFVLYLPYTRPGRSRPYCAFFAKRLCRIYLPYLAGLVIAVAAYLLFFHPGSPPGVTFFYSWKPLGGRELRDLLLQHVLFLGSFHREYLNSATWSLAEELRISLLFPLLAAIVSRLRWQLSLLLAIVSSLLVAVAIARVHHHFPLITLHYAAIFVLGAVLCSRRTELLLLWRRGGRPLQACILLGGVLLSWYAPRLARLAPSLFPEELIDWLIALGASVFLISALADTGFSRLLRHRHMQHLGRISYGFYLLHLPLLFVALNLFWTRLPHLATFAIALVATTLGADLFYRVIERPSIALGKHLELRLTAPRLPLPATRELL